MPTRLPTPSPATVIACIALFVALGGTGYAALNLPNNSVGAKQLKPGSVTSKAVRDGAIRSRDVRNRSLTGRDLRANTIRGREILESSLGTVPSATNAANANTLGGHTAQQLKTTCPAGTLAASAACIETAYRPAASWGLANATCSLAGRRLATYGELRDFLTPQRPAAPGGEWTSNVGESSTTPGQLVATVINTGSQIEFIDAAGAVPRAYRCLAGPAN